MGQERYHRQSPSSPASSRIDTRKRPLPSSASGYPENSPPPRYRDQNESHQQKMGKRPTFSSYLDTPNLPLKVKLLCEIVVSTPSVNVEKVLEDAGIRVSQQDVEEVLKLSYGYPSSAVKFFRWSGNQLHDQHSPYAWNLVVDLLGKNCLFDAMWDAIKSMKKERLLSLATFASVFSSYASADRVQESIMAFEAMDQYGCPRDIVALNSLLSALCRDAKTKQAKEFLNITKDKIRPDADSYAILLEGWENERDVASARQTFAEMVVDIGWDPGNIPAYDSFLNTLLEGRDGMREAMKFLDSMTERKCCPSMKFFKVALKECLKNRDARGAELLWNAKNGCQPDTEMYNLMISSQCEMKDADLPLKLLDEMVYNGAFPDSRTYNLLFRFLIKCRKLKEASSIFTEMIKNECVPSHRSCCSAVRQYVDSGDFPMAIKVWKCMIENHYSDLEETGNLLVVGLSDGNRVPEAVKYAEDMIDRGIKLNSSTLSKLKQSLSKAGKALAYESLLVKWKNHY